jgi:hypothetical protein
MKTFVDNFSNQSSGDMDEFFRTANAKNLIASVAPMPGQVFTNVGNVDDNFRTHYLWEAYLTPSA